MEELSAGKAAEDEEERNLGTGAKPGGPPPKNQRAKRARGKALRRSMLGDDLERAVRRRIESDEE